jgi:hypothetical protein
MEEIIIPTHIREEETSDIINRAVKNHTLFAFGKNRHDLYYYLYEEFFKKANSNEIVFWDKKKKALINTGLTILEDKITKDVLKDWKKKYR